MKKVHIIYMAAGNSRRFGNNNKLLSVYNGKELFKHGLDTLTKLMKNKIPDAELSLTVVTRFDEILEYAAGYAVFSPESADGVSYTIRNGINYAIEKYGQCDYLMFLVADQPKITAASIEKVIMEAVSGEHQEKTYALAYGDRKGNPALFHASLIPELLELKDDEGGSVVMKKNKPHLVFTQNPMELYDIDTIYDLNGLFLF